MTYAVSRPSATAEVGAQFTASAQNFHHSVDLSYDKAIASSKVSSPDSAISYSLFHLPVPYRFLKVIQ
jgi:hypothetical protein